ncbi:MAG: dihydroorotate dehydrogenase electron transfer subunit [Chloroflexi bacterium]|nr:dihydroorotate dehydrogenase electron transfer subunit [Chloroflexota bacterium]
MKQTKATVISNMQILPASRRRGAAEVLGSWLMWLHCPEIAGTVRPGQFVMVRCQGCALPRPLSVHRINDRGELSLLFTVREGARGTAWLSRRKAGDNLELFGPMGNGFTINPGAETLLLVAGGIGIAPLYFLAQDALTRGCSVKFLYGAPTASDLLPEQMLPPGLEVASATDDGTAGREGMVTSLLLLPDLLPGFTLWADQVFACGPRPMYETMARMPEMKGKPVQVSLEIGMGCGLGVCYSCTIRTRGGLKQVCQDGPVFELSDILWNEQLMCGV